MPALGVFADVVQQVIKDAPHMPPVGHDLYGFLRLCEDELQPSGGELFAVFARHLVEQDAKLALGEVHAQTAARCLGRFEQIVNELLELCRLPVEHLEVLAHLFILRLLLFKQVNIVDDGGERGLDIVGDVGDKLGAEALGLHALAHGAVHAVGDGVEVLAVLLERAAQPGGIDLAVELALGAALPASEQLLPRQQRIQRGQHQNRALDEPAEELLSGTCTGDGDP